MNNVLDRLHDKCISSAGHEARDDMQSAGETSEKRSERVKKRQSQLSQTEAETACKEGKWRWGDRKCNVDHLASSTKSHFVQSGHETPCLLSWQIFPPRHKSILSKRQELRKKFPFQAQQIDFLVGASTPVVAMSHDICSYSAGAHFPSFLE